MKKYDKKPFTIILGREDFGKLTALAEKESRPVAQMARVIIERALKPEVKK